MSSRNHPILTLSVGQRENLQILVKRKIGEISTYTDDVLPEYIMVMLANRKEAAQIEHDLEAFLLDRAAPFVSWLWTTIAQLASASDLIIEEPAAAKQSTASSAHQRVASQLDAAGHRSPPRQSTRNLSPDSSLPRGQMIRSEYDGRLTHRSRSRSPPHRVRSRSPEYRRDNDSRSMHDRPEYRADRRDNDRYREHNRHANEFSGDRRDRDRDRRFAQDDRRRRSPSPISRYDDRREHDKGSERHRANRDTDLRSSSKPHESGKAPQNSRLTDSTPLTQQARQTDVDFDRRAVFRAALTGAIMDANREATRKRQRPDTDAPATPEPTMAPPPSKKLTSPDSASDAKSTTTTPRKSIWDRVSVVESPVIRSITSGATAARSVSIASKSEPKVKLEDELEEDGNDVQFAGAGNPVKFTVVLPKPEVKARHKFVRDELVTAGIGDETHKYVISQDPMDVDILPNGNYDSDEESLIGQKDVVKCKFYPNCLNADCAFYHPSKFCKRFPKCKFGDKCLFIHPQKLCRFGARCTRSDCPHKHPPKLTDMCKDGFSCQRPLCKFLHPAEACQFGEACTSRKCAYAHGKSCRYGAKCHIQGCTYTHSSKLGVYQQQTNYRIEQDDDDEDVVLDQATDSTAPPKSTAPPPIVNEPAIVEQTDDSISIKEEEEDQPRVKSEFQSSLRDIDEFL